MKSKNKIVIISQEGANSDQITYEFNGVEKSVDNCQTNWSMIRALLLNPINQVCWEKRGPGGWVIESGAFDEFGNPVRKKVRKSENNCLHI
jgi:hypothetical protein